MGRYSCYPWCSPGTWRGHSAPRRENRSHPISAAHRSSTSVWWLHPWCPCNRHASFLHKLVPLCQDAHASKTFFLLLSILFIFCKWCTVTSWLKKKKKKKSSPEFVFSQNCTELSPSLSLSIPCHVSSSHALVTEWKTKLTSTQTRHTQAVHLHSDL